MIKALYLIIFFVLQATAYQYKHLKVSWNICNSKYVYPKGSHQHILDIKNSQFGHSISFLVNPNANLFWIQFKCSYSEEVAVPFSSRKGDVYIIKTVYGEISIKTSEGFSTIYHTPDSCRFDKMTESILWNFNRTTGHCFQVNHVNAKKSGFEIRNITDTLPCNDCGCDANLCVNGGNCVEDLKNKGVKCQCKEGYSGEKCQIEKKCSNKNSNDRRCKRNSSIHLSRSKRAITDACTPNNSCENNGICYLDKESKTCTCPSGLTGEVCQFVSCAASNPCKFASVCNVTNCICVDGFQGTICDSMINNCQTCNNSAKCFEMYKDFECVDSLVDSKFTGKLANISLTGCSLNKCQNNTNGKTRCVPILTKDGNQSHTCNCIFGKTGDTCEKSTIHTINTVSNFQHTPSNVSKIVYSMRLKTFGPGGYIFTLKFKEDTTLFLGVEVQNGGIKVSTATESKLMTQINSVGTSKTEFIPTEYHLEFKSVSGVNLVCLSVRIQTASNELQGSVMCVKYSGSSMTPTFILGKPNSVFETSVNSILKARFLLSDVINACYQDFSINGVYEPTPIVSIGCLVKTSCTTDSCQITKGRGEKCVEYLSTEKCICKRPFTGTTCENDVTNQLVNIQANGYMALAFENSFRNKLNRQIDVSLFIQTASINGILFYMGSTVATNIDALSTELKDGYLSVNSRNSTDIKVENLLFNDNLSWKINNQQKFLVSISLIGSQVTLKLELYNNDLTKVRLILTQTKSFSNKFMPNYISRVRNLAIVFYGPGPKPAPAAIVAPSIPLAGRPDFAFETPPGTKELFTNPVSIKGIFKDLEINGVKFNAEQRNIQGTLGEVLPKTEVKPNLCANGGTYLKNEFDQNVCVCLPNYYGNLCQYIDQCKRANPCSAPGDCVRIENDTVCKAPFSIIKSNSQVELSVKNSAINFTEIRMKLKTRSINSIVFEITAQLSGSSNNVKAILSINSAGNLEGTVMNTDSNTNLGSKVVSAQAINDAISHTIVFQFSPGISVEIDSAMNRASDYGKPELAPFTVPAAASNNASVKIGDASKSFLGCFEDVFLNTHVISTKESLAKNSSVISVLKAPVEMKCVGKDSCKPNPCQKSGNCTDIFNDYSCVCIKDYEGKSCDIPKCSVIKCETNIQNNTCGQICPSTTRDECSIKTIRYGCNCTTGWVGPLCNIRNSCLNPSDSSQICLNEAKCKYTINQTSNTSTYSCTCVNGYTGTICNVAPTTIPKTIIPTTILPTIPPVTVSTQRPLNTAEVAGIAIGVILGIVLLCLLIALIVYCCKKKQAQKQQKREDEIDEYIESVLKKPMEEKLI